MSLKAPGLAWQWLNESSIATVGGYGPESQVQKGATFYFTLTPE